MRFVLPARLRAVIRARRRRVASRRRVVVVLPVRRQQAVVVAAVVAIDPLVPEFPPQEDPRKRFGTARCRGVFLSKSSLPPVQAVGKST